MIRQTIRRLVLGLVLLIPAAALAQTPSSAPPTSGNQQLKPHELEALVAPIALYPDPLLAQVLMASTYPTQIVQADRWVQNNQNLKGDALKSAAEKQSWDDSVKGLVVTPSVLAMMSKELDWTQKLGDAVVAQEADVMDAIQRLRARAQASHKLESNQQQKVSVTQEGGRQLIAIEPTDPGTIYVPYYDPNIVYGGWPYPDYAPYYWGYPGYIGAGIIATGLAFGTGYALGRWASGNCCWGGRFDWNRNNINIGSGNRVTHWQSNRQPRRGNTNLGGNRGNLGGNRGNLGNLGNRGGNLGNRGGGNRVTHHQAGNRGGNRHAGNRTGGNRQASNRPRGGNRHATHRAGGGNRVANRPSAGRHVASRGGGARMGGGGARMGGGGHARMGGGGRGGGGRGGGGRGGGGRRSDIALKHDVVLLGRMNNGLGFYRFSYNGSNRAYVGVIAQEVREVMPRAVWRGRDGYLRVDYDTLGVPFETYQRWVATGTRLPVTVPMH